MRADAVEAEAVRSERKEAVRWKAVGSICSGLKSSSQQSTGHRQSSPGVGARLRLRKDEPMRIRWKRISFPQSSVKEDRKKSLLWVRFLIRALGWLMGRDGNPFDSIQVRLPIWAFQSFDQTTPTQRCVLRFLFACAPEDRASGLSKEACSLVSSLSSDLGMSVRFRSSFFPGP